MPRITSPEDNPISAIGGPSKKRKRSRGENSERRCTNACRRCKRMKLKCTYLQVDGQIRCLACCNSNKECQIDEPPVRALGSSLESEHVSNLESRIKTLEQELTRGKQVSPERYQSTIQDHGALATPPGSNDIPHSIHHKVADHARHGSAATDTMTAPYSIATDVSFPQAQKFPVLEPDGGPSPPILIYGGQTATHASIDPPEDEVAERLVEAAYSYVQARYCMVDWTRVRVWQQQRDQYLNSTRESEASVQIGSFFLWIIYAIGARFVSDAGQESSEAYFNQASKHLPTIMTLQNMETVQALLCMIQCCFRAQKGPSLWDLTRMVTSLCIKLRFHRSVTKVKQVEALDPYTVELRKRFWWCAFCFDRCVSMLAKLPFSIRDSDIDVEEPVNIDDTCLDQDKIRTLQQQQVNGIGDTLTDRTTMSSALQHLTIYRIRSAVTTRFAGPNAEVPSFEDVQSFLTKLNEWRAKFPKTREQAWFPQQPPDRVQATYLQAVLVLIRPVLLQESIEPALLTLCASFSAEACESGRNLSLDPQTYPDRITVFHCFFCGITLLQCLTIDPSVLPKRRIHQATSACLSSLAVYSRALPAVKPFMHLYGELVNRLFGDDDEVASSPNPELRMLLNQVISSDPSETPELLRSLCPQALQGEQLTQNASHDPSGQFRLPDTHPEDLTTLQTSQFQHRTTDEDVSFSQVPMYELDLPDLDTLIFDVANPDVGNIWSTSWLDNLSMT